jgi:amino acid permease
MLQEDRVLWTQSAKGVAMILGAVFLVVACNLSAYLTQKLCWIPKTRRGQMLSLLVLLGAIIVYIMLGG